MLSVLLKVTQQLDKESCSSYWGLPSYPPPLYLTAHLSLAHTLRLD